MSVLCYILLVVGVYIIFFIFIVVSVGLFEGSIYYSWHVNLLEAASWLLELSLSTEDYLCLVMLLFCGVLSLQFSNHYFGESKTNLNSLIILFLGIMSLLVASGNYLSTLVMWEYLGFVSFLLILYYANYNTAHAGNVTLVSSRFGDVGLFLVVCSGWGNISSSVLLLTFGYVLVILTKSAAIPFTSWLLEAMRAPTPVSCLVHSSTLVAAGVWFAVTYGNDIGFNESFIITMCCFSSIILSASCACYFTDIKKVVALSTCNNISWCLLYYLLGFSLLSIIQLVSHGVAKCMLFMGVGDSLAGSFSSQQSSNFLSPYYVSLGGGVNSSLLMLLVSGIPFNGVFFSKHFLLSENSYSNSISLSLLLAYCIYLTYLYTSRLMFLAGNTLNSNNNSIYNVINIICLFIIIPSLLNYMLCLNSEEVMGVSGFISLVIIVSQLLGFLGGYKLSLNPGSGSFWYCQVGGQDIVIGLIYSFWRKLLGVLSTIMFRWEPYSFNGLISSLQSWNYLSSPFIVAVIGGFLVILLGLIG
uniref:NADH:ubiquinone reductase (H(+)-translocating) n=1 Tax=Tetrancistrum nebulosi TaxID=879209 RepID=I3NLS2_9PLAT|nr:NADH dehydrogenase subunit 5 [Tetrancistrum nebulosi]ADN44065.1 NADH dehydrogenase subunit 5 [Tetrancistrum nebulosi]